MNDTNYHKVRNSGSNPANFWDDFDWDELLPMEQRLWEILGWDAESWDEQKPAPETDNLDFDELSEQEMIAAMALGFRKAKLWG